MNIVNLNGGLGNQLFQYAFGKSIEFKFGHKAVFTNEFINQSQLSIDNIFDLDIPLINKKLLNKFNLPAFEYSLIRNYLPRILKKMKISEFHNIVIEQIENPNHTLPEYNLKFLFGYWQNYNFFIDYLDELKNILIFKKNLQLVNLLKKNRIEFNEIVGLHVRRGDFLQVLEKHDIYFKIEDSYYYNAINFFKSKLINPIFLVFSDDPEFVKRKFTDKKIIHASQLGISQNDDFQAMSQCDHFICINSTFSLWARYLSKNKHKISTKPKYWFSNKHLEKAFDYFPSTWSFEEI